MGKHERERNCDRQDKWRHKRQRGDEKKKAKKSNKHKEKNKKEKKRYRREQGDPPTLDYKRALEVVRSLLTETPEIAKDLLSLLERVDDGQVAIIGGIENRHIRSKLKELFPLLGLVKLRQPKDAFAKPSEEKHYGKESLIEVFHKMLSEDIGEVSGSKRRCLLAEPTIAQSTTTLPDDEHNKLSSTECPEPATKMSFKRDVQIGPALPPQSVVGDDQDDNDDEIVGPALPGMRGFRLPDERVEAEIFQKAQQLEKEQWQRVRNGCKNDTAEGDKTIPMTREAWMTMMPESSILKDSFGSQTKPPPGKPTAFRRQMHFNLIAFPKLISEFRFSWLCSKEPAAVDKTWFDLPDERERKKRAKLDMELLGYVRHENAPNAKVASSIAASASLAVKDSTSIVAKSEADEEMRKQMENLRKARGPSLLEQHQREQAELAKAGGKSTKSGRGWNRDRDLTIRRGMSGDDAERMITAAKQINSKFTAPTITRQFL
ncbi:hypothetical protein PsorP6_004047 [Peronosclerospora sorghi]|uniref:Uncharacterized protein n=1 Tax=Peronosclerospora sorghi TaxID=230839 RepID=A0ACC0VQT6_9STRA|nr:hypothetical protein PsorP6_004047 [Peronosclerospora sorghi]